MEKSTVGMNIKHFREAKEMTQKMLADSLNVTPQAVSRWETDAVEPDIETLKQIAVILEASVNDIIGVEEKPATAFPEPMAHSAVTYSTTSPVMIGTCVKCGKVVTENNVGRRISIPYTKHSGRTRFTVPSHPELVCYECVEAEKKAADEEVTSRKRQDAEDRESRRKKGLIWAIILASLYFIISLIVLIDVYSTFGKFASDFVISVILSYLIFSTTFVLIMNNTFINNMVLEIFSWGFVKMPGIIFSLDLNGLFFLLTVKLFLFLLGIVIALGFGAIALALGIPMCAFAFPFSLKKSYGTESVASD